MKPKVYAIVVTYNGEKYIEKCLSSLQDSSVDVHTIVIDNQSSDNTISIIENKFSSVELIKAKQNLGFGRGNNIGLKRAHEDAADYIFLLNQDAWIASNTIERLIAVQKENKEYGILSPIHLDWEGEELEYYFRTIIGETACPNFIADLYKQNLTNIYAIDFIHAACWLIAKDCLKTVGGFDPIFPHYGEDIDYINRTKIAGFKVGISPNTEVRHYGTHDGLRKMQYNLRLHLNLNYNYLKNTKYKFKGLLFVFIKQSIDKIISSILYRRLRDFKFNIHLLYKTLLAIPKILRSRKECKAKCSFLIVRDTKGRRK